MPYKLARSLGFDAARKCNVDFGAKLDITKPDSLAEGQVIDLPGDAAAYLNKISPDLLEETGRVHGVAKKPELTAPEK